MFGVWSLGQEYSFMRMLIARRFLPCVTWQPDEGRVTQKKKRLTP